MSEPELIRHALKASGVHKKIVTEVWPNGVLATCPCCNKQEKLTAEQTIECLASGWPKCCGRSMTISEVRS